MSDSIRCAVRVRPNNSFDDRVYWGVAGNSINKKTSTEKYTYEHVYDQIDTTEGIYGQLIAPLIDGALEGYNTAIMAYGQSGSGKTHTLTGSGTEEGILQLSLHSILRQISMTDRAYVLRLSVAEIYNEKIFDLLRDEKGLEGGLCVRDNGRGEFVIDGLHERHITSDCAVDLMVQEVADRRNVGETFLNDRSSRSHVIYLVKIESSGKVGSATLSSTLSLVDLAGSENASATQGQMQRATEGKHINKSLLSLCKVITQLSEKSPHVAYRESQLTKLLKSSLGGNSRCLILATFAKCAVKVKVEPKVNETAEDGVLAQYLAQIEELKEQLKSKSDVDEAESRLEEKTRRLEELKKLILVGGTKTEQAPKSKKNRRMTWAPGKLASTFSPLRFFKKEKTPVQDAISEEIEEREDPFNNARLSPSGTSDPRASIASLPGEKTSSRPSIASLIGGSTRQSIAALTIDAETQTDPETPPTTGVQLIQTDITPTLERETQIDIQAAECDVKAVQTDDEEPESGPVATEDVSMQTDELSVRQDDKEVQVEEEKAKDLLDAVCQTDFLPEITTIDSPEKNNVTQYADNEHQIAQLQREIHKLVQEIQQKNDAMAESEKEKSQLVLDVQREKWEKADIRRAVLTELQSKIQKKMEEMSDEIEQLKREKNILEDRIEFLVRAEQSMYVGRGGGLEDTDELNNKISEYQKEVAQQAEMLRERDQYITDAEGKMTALRARNKDIEKRVKDQKELLEQRADQINRFRDEVSKATSTLRDKEDAVKVATASSEKMKRERDEATAEAEKATLAAEKAEKQRDNESQERARVKEREEAARQRALLAEGDASIEKKKREALEKEAARIRAEYDQYKKMMGEKEEMGRAKAIENVSYWENRARTAEEKLQRKKAQKHESLQSTENILPPRI